MMAEKLKAPFKPPKQTAEPRFPSHAFPNKRQKKLGRDDDKSYPLGTNQMKKHTLASSSSPKSQEDSLEEKQSRKYYLCLYNNPQTKMHKTWESDGYIVLKPGYGGISLYDTTSKKCVSSEVHSRYKALSIDTIYFIGSKEVKVCEETSYEKLFSQTTFPSKQNKERTNEKGTIHSGFKAPAMKPLEERRPVPQEAPKEKCIPSSSFYGPSTNQGRMVGISKRDNDPRKGALYSSDESSNLIAMNRPDEKHQAAHMNEDDKIVDVHINPLLAKALRPHQVEGVKFLYHGTMQIRNLINSRETIYGKDEDNPTYAPPTGGVILADDMGLGKTLQTITVIDILLHQNCYLPPDPPRGRPRAHRGAIERALVVCPATLVKNWKHEFTKWVGTGIRVVCIEEKTDLKNVIHGNYEVMIIGYEKAKLNAHSLKKVHPKFGLLVCDEAHRLKGKDSQLNTELQNFLMDKKIFLTGTPFQNNLTEFFTMVNLIAPLYLGDYQTFKNVFETPILRGRRPHCPAKHRKLADERSEQLRMITAPLLLRREANLLTQILPTKHEIIIFCNPSKLQHRIFNALANGTESSKSFFEIIREQNHGQLVSIGITRKLSNVPDLIIEDLNGKGSVGQSTRNILESFRYLLPRCETYNAEDSGKLCLLMKMLRAIRKDTNDKIVLVSNFTKMLDLVEMICNKANFPQLRLDGKVKQNQRMNIVNQFNKGDSSGTFIMLLSAKAGGVGLNLIGANRLILLDGDWNPAIDAQAMARIHREGQKKDCFIYRLMLSGTIDEKIFQRQLSKSGLSDALFGKSEQISGSSKSPRKGNALDQFTDDELRDIFNYDEGASCGTHDLLHCPCQGKGEIVPEEDLQEDQGDEELNLPDRKVIISASQLRKMSPKGKMKENRRKFGSLFDWTHHDFSSPNHSAPTKDEILNKLIKNAASEQEDIEFSSNKARSPGEILFVMAKMSKRAEIESSGEVEEVQGEEEEEQEDDE